MYFICLIAYLYAICCPVCCEKASASACAGGEPSLLQLCRVSCVVSGFVSRLFAVVDFRTGLDPGRRPDGPHASAGTVFGVYCFFRTGVLQYGLSVFDMYCHF